MNPEELTAIAAAEGNRQRPDRPPRDRGPRNGGGGRDRDRDRGPRNGGGDDRGGRVRDRDPDRPRS
jgi:hypothetical protein